VFDITIITPMHNVTQLEFVNQPKYTRMPGEANRLLSRRKTVLYSHWVAHRRAASSQTGLAWLRWANKHTRCTRRQTHDSRDANNDMPCCVLSDPNWSRLRNCPACFDLQECLAMKNLVRLKCVRVTGNFKTGWRRRVSVQRKRN